MKVKVSVIIPVYNAEKYIKKSLSSIINQSLEEIEIIIVNDGSTDRSIEIAKKICKSDKRVKIIEQQNSGVASARNLGINQSKGEYISFIDSDDWIENDMLEQLYINAIRNKCDVIQCRYKKLSSQIDNDIIYDKVLSNNEIERYLKDNLIIGKLSTYSWDKIYKLDFIKNNGIRFKNVPMFEDWYFMIDVITYMKRYMFLNQSLYNYSVIEESLSRKYHDNFTDMVIDLQKEKFKYMKIWNKSGKNYYKVAILNLYDDILRIINYEINNKISFKKKIKKLSENKFIESNLTIENIYFYLKNTSINSWYCGPLLYAIKLKKIQLIYIWIKIYNKIAKII